MEQCWNLMPYSVTQLLGACTFCEDYYATYLYRCWEGQKVVCQYPICQKCFEELTGEKLTPAPGVKELPVGLGHIGKISGIDFVGNEAESYVTITTSHDPGLKKDDVLKLNSSHSIIGELKVTKINNDAMFKLLGIDKKKL